MKNILDFVKESIMNNDDDLNKKKVRDYGDFIDYLGDLSDKEIDVIEHINSEIKKICNDKRINYKSFFNSTALEAIFMLAAMLIDDNEPFTKVQQLGFNAYKGNNNPYDYSWFEGDDEDEPLDIFQLWCKNNSEKFETIYELVKRHKDKLTVDWIWGGMREYV